MNGIIEAICHHISRKRHIIGIEADGRYNAIVIYLNDGGVHPHPNVAVCYAQFVQRRHDAEKMFPNIPWHQRGDAVADWLASFWASRAKQRSRFQEVERELSAQISDLIKGLSPRATNC